MGYENAPATKMIAVYCASCSKELLDAVSVEAGMGPDCRRKHGVPDTLDEESRAKANKLVHRIACEQVDNAEVRAALDALLALGCVTLVARINKRLYGEPVQAYVHEGKLVVRSRFNGDYNSAVRSIRSRRWTPALKANVFSPADWRAVDAALSCYGKAFIEVSRDGGETYETAAPRAGVLEALCSGIAVPAMPPPAPAPRPRTVVRVCSDTSSGYAAIVTPYHGDLVSKMRSVPGRAWDGRANLFPLKAVSDVLAIAREAFGDLDIVETEGRVVAPRTKSSRRGGYAAPAPAPEKPPSAGGPFW